MATHKVVTLEGVFPEMVIKNMYQQGRGQGSTLKAAFAAAGRDLFSKKGLRGRRLTVAKLTVSIGTIETEENDLSPEKDSGREGTDASPRRKREAGSGSV